MTVLNIGVADAKTLLKADFMVKDALPAKGENPIFAPNKR